MPDQKGRNQKRPQVGKCVYVYCLLYCSHLIVRSSFWPFDCSGCSGKIGQAHGVMNFWESATFTFYTSTCTRRGTGRQGAGRRGAPASTVQQLKYHVPVNLGRWVQKNSTCTSVYEQEMACWTAGANSVVVHKYRRHHSKLLLVPTS